MSKKVAVYKIDGSQSGEVELNEAIFNARVNERLLELVLKAYAGNQRLGTHDTKERKEVSGGGKKPWKQKGTGRARHGSIRSPIWRGGGTVFGPTPRSYATNLPQEMRAKALISALSFKSKKEQLIVVEDIELDQAKTKELKKIIDALKIGSFKTLYIAPAENEKLKRASNNLKEIFSMKRAGDVNAYHILRRSRLLIAKSALNLIEKRLLEGQVVHGQKELVTA